MKNSPITTVLLVVLAFCTLVSAIACGKYVWRSREMRRLQTAVLAVQRNQAIINALVSDALEYSKKNPSIDPLLEQIGVKPGKTNPAPAKPASK